MDPVEERHRLCNATKHINKHVVELTEKVASETAVLADMMTANQQLHIKEHTQQDILVADYDIEMAQYRIGKAMDLLARAKEIHYKFAVKHC